MEETMRICLKDEDFIEIDYFGCILYAPTPQYVDTDLYENLIKIILAHNSSDLIVPQTMQCHVGEIICRINCLLIDDYLFDGYSGGTLRACDYCPTASVACYYCYECNRDMCIYCHTKFGNKIVKKMK